MSKFQPATEVKEEIQTCTVCGREISYADGFQCTDQPGPCQLPYKQYYTLGARHIQDRKERRKFALFLILRPAGESWVNGQQIVNSPQIAAQFHDSKFGTTDAELQWYLDREKEVLSGPAGEAAWKEMALTPEQQATAAQQELVALQAKIRSMREDSSLLDQVKQSTK